MALKCTIVHKTVLNKTHTEIIKVIIIIFKNRTYYIYSNR